MPTVRVEEAYAERDETIDAKGNVIEVEIPYLVFGVADESAALTGTVNKSSFRGFVDAALASARTRFSLPDSEIAAILAECAAD